MYADSRFLTAPAAPVGSAPNPPAAHEALTLCLVSDDEPVRAAVRACCLPPHRLRLFSFSEVLTPDHRLSESGLRLVEAAAGADALLVGWSISGAALVGLLCHRLRAQTQAWPYVPVFALCGGSQEDHLAAWAMGVDDVLHFPLYLPLLQARITARRRSADRIRQAAVRRLFPEPDTREAAAEIPSGAPAEAPRPFSVPGDGMAGVEAPRDLHALAPVAVPETPQAPDPGHEVLQTGRLRLDRTAYRFYIGPEEVELSPKEFDLLGYLMAHAEEACTRDDLLDHVWGIDFDTGTNMVDSYVYFLRKKLAAYGLKGMIQTVRGIGYRLSYELKASS